MSLYMTEKQQKLFLKAIELQSQIAYLQGAAKILEPLVKPLNDINLELAKLQKELEMINRVFNNA